MKYRALDDYGDSTFGSQKFYVDTRAVAQAILTRLRLLYGEWWEKTDEGLPLFESILGVYGGDEARAAVDLLISERIQQTQGVRAIIAYESEFDPQSRGYSANCIVETIFGEFELSIRTAEYIFEIEVK